MSIETQTPAPTTPAAPAMPIQITDRAIAKVQHFASTMEGAEGKALRIFVQGGGCSGFQYGFTFDEATETDTVLAVSGIQVLIDPASFQYLKDATVDYVEDFRGAGFTVINPNSSGSCGCGKSFSA